MEKKVSKRNTQSSSSISIKNSVPIPVDLIIEIFLKLPAKSISRFRCVSKEWASILGRQDFTDPFLTMSSSRPRLLFSLITDGKWFFFSAPQPLNPDQNSSPLVVDYHLCFPTIMSSPYIHAYVFGLVYTKYRWFQPGFNELKVVIYNPSTGQSIPLPLLKRRGYVKTYFGYDPINKQYKVLCMSDRVMTLNSTDEHQVLTIGTEKLSWKKIECSLPHIPISSGICINGVLYYSAKQRYQFPKRFTVICFDVRSEKFKFIEPPDNINAMWRPTMINYIGKLGVLVDGYTFFSSETTSFELWVLDDVEKNKWSNHIYVLPPMWKNLVGDTILHIVGMTGNGEIVFSPSVLYDPFYIFFYNLAKNSIVRVMIQGIESTKPQRIHTFIDHVECVKRM